MSAMLRGVFLGLLARGSCCPLVIFFTIEGALLNPLVEHPDYPVFFYRGDILMAVRYGAYKMHVVTWATPEKYAQPASCHKLEFSHV